MRKEYDFADGIKNPYAAKQKIETFEYDSAIFLDNDELILLYLEEAKAVDNDTFLDASANVARAENTKI